MNITKNSENMTIYWSLVVFSRKSSLFDFLVFATCVFAPTRFNRVKSRFQKASLPFFAAYLWKTGSTDYKEGRDTHTCFCLYLFAASNCTDCLFTRVFRMLTSCADRTGIAHENSISFHDLEPSHCLLYLRFGDLRSIRLCSNLLSSSVLRNFSKVSPKLRFAAFRNALFVERVFQNGISLLINEATL